MEFITNNKGGRKLCYLNHMYTKYAETKGGTWWKCVKKSTLKCTGLKINGVQVLYSRDHDHAGDMDSINACKVRNQMKERAMSSRDSPTQIFTESVARMCPTVRPHMPTEESCKRTIRNQRPSLPSHPTRIQLGYIPQEYTVFVNGDQKEDFSIYDNGAYDANLMLFFFATNEGLRHLAEAETWFMDGNFSMAPDIFCQLYTIRVPLGTSAITTVYALQTPQDTRGVFRSCTF